MMMRYKKNNLLYDILFCLIISVVLATQITLGALGVLGVLGIIYLPELGLTSKFWIAILNICRYIWTIGNSMLFLGFVSVSIQLVISDIKSYKMGDKENYD